MVWLQDFIFPTYDVRFIAINDDVDSAKGENDFAVFKNVFNDYYAKDTSKKIRAASRQQFALWVHKRSAGQKEMDCRRRSGKGGAAHLQSLHCQCPMQIAKILTADRVLIVTAYHARQKGWAMPENLY